MHKKILSNECKNSDRITADSSDPTQTRSIRRLERSRIAILNGWILSMIGIVCYCFVMLRNEAGVDPFSSIFERGLMGWAAVLFMVIGVGLWLVGSLTYLKEESEQLDDNDDNDDNDA